MIRRSKNLMVGGVEREVSFKELTVAEIRAWLAGKGELDDLVDTTLFDEVALSDLPALTDLDSERVAAMTPSEIEAVVAEAKEVNARFFLMRARIVEIGRRMLETQ